MLFIAKFKAILNNALRLLALSAITNSVWMELTVWWIDYPCSYTAFIYGLATKVTSGKNMIFWFYVWTFSHLVLFVRDVELLRTWGILYEPGRIGIKQHKVSLLNIKKLMDLENLRLLLTQSGSNSFSVGINAALCWHLQWNKFRFVLFPYVAFTGIAAALPSQNYRGPNLKLQSDSIAVLLLCLAVVGRYAFENGRTDVAYRTQVWHHSNACHYTTYL
jgi:hypothetical protein